MKKIMLMLGVILMSVFMLCGCNKEADLEKSAVPLVTSMLKDEFGDVAVKCVGVKITEKVSDKHYKAKATLANGNDIKIMIEELDNNMLSVTIPLDQ